MVIMFGPLLLAAWTTGYLTGTQHRTIKTPVHEHQWGPWQPPQSTDSKYDLNFIQFRQCTNCGLAEKRLVSEARP